MARIQRHAVILLSTGAVLLAACAATFAPPRASTFAEFLAARQDLVVEGYVLGMTEVTRRPEETCGTRGLMPLPLTEVELRIARVRSGVAEDSIVTIYVDGHRLFPDGYAPANRVIAWGNRSCDDGWRIYGRLAVIMADGHVVDPRGGAVMHADHDPGEVTTAQLEAEMARLEDQPANPFEGATAVALTRRADKSGWTSTGATYRLDSLGWAMGKGSHVPRYLAFPLLPGCVPDIYPGDSLLVPLSQSSMAVDTLVVDKCPSSWRLKHGYAPGLATRIEETGLERALMWVGTTLRVRGVLLQEQ